MAVRRGRISMKRISATLICMVLTIFALTPSLLAKPLVARKSMGEQRALILMVRFPDVTPTVSIADMEPKYLVKLDRYMQDVSYGKAWVTGECKGWYDLPKPVKKYRISRHNHSVKRGRVDRLIQDAIDLADKDVDFSRYSFVILSLGAKLKDYGMKGLCGYPGMLGWTSKKVMKTKSGQRVPGGVAIYAEDAHLGVVFHDVAHILGGVIDDRRVVPCLYDHDLQGQKGPFRGYAKFYMINMGYFDPMSCHVYKAGMGPPGICSWTKLRLNWLDPERIVEVGPGEEKTVKLRPLARRGMSKVVIRIPLDENTYYLVENRAPVLEDKNMPENGVLVLLCDDRIPECRHGKAPVKAMNARPDIPELVGAPFGIGPGEVDTFTDSARGVKIRLLGRSGLDYRVLVTRTR